MDNSSTTSTQSSQSSESKVKNYSTQSLKNSRSSKVLIKTIQEIDKLSLTNDHLVAEIIKFVSSQNGLLGSYKRDVDLLFEYALKIMPKSHENHFLIWTKYLNVAIKMMPVLCKGEPEVEAEYKQYHEQIEKNWIRYGGEKNPTDNFDASIDWRVAKKIFQYRDILGMPAVEGSKDIEFMLAELKNQILKAYNYLIWCEKLSKAHEFAKAILVKFMSYISDKANESKITESIICGRFDKKDLASVKISKSIVFGEDGGLFILMNNFDEDTECLQEAVGMEYLQDKIHLQGEKKKIIIGKGAFGSVKFAMSLFVTNLTLPGNVVCLKKTKKLSFLREAMKDDPEADPVGQIIDTSVGDYFSTSDEITQMIYSPKVIDISLNLSSILIDPSHQKGYLMMEIVPQNTGTGILIKNDRKVELDWVSDQKPYILQVFRQTDTLLSSNIAMMDLKPDNTLYDLDNKRAFIIDLGGSQYVEEGVEQCITKRHDFQFTKAYTAPEFLQVPKQVNLKKALSFTCGKILSDVLKPTKDTNPFTEVLSDISRRLMLDDPVERLSIKDAIEEIIKIGDDTTKNVIQFQRYISKVRDRLKNNKSSISINEDIEEIKDLLIPPKVTLSDPEVAKTLPTEDLAEKLKAFLEKSPPVNELACQEDVMVILGNAGSGKSVMLQLEFIKAVESWTGLTQPIPVYFNLANGTNLNDILNSLDNQLNTNLKDFLFDPASEKNLLVFIDSFDEGIYHDEAQRQSLIKNFFARFRSDWKKVRSCIKFVITCRTDYIIPIKNFHEFFTPQKQDRNLFEMYYIVPFNHKGEAKTDKVLDPQEEIYKKTYLGLMASQTAKSKENFSVQALIKEIVRVDAMKEQKKNMYAYMMAINSLLSDVPSEVRDVIFTQKFIDYLHSKKEDLGSKVTGGNESLGNFIKNYIAHSKDEIKNKDYKYYLDMIEQANIEDNITTGFLFHMLMKTYIYNAGVNQVEESSNWKIQNITDLYTKFVKMYIEKNLKYNFSLTREQKIGLIENLEAFNMSDSEIDEKFFNDMEDMLYKIGMKIASALHLKGDHRIRNEDELFRLLDFNPNPILSFKSQRLYYILRNLPLKIEVKKSSQGNSNEIAIGFIHDTIKNYFLLEVIKKEATENPKQSNSVLGAKILVDDPEFIIFLRESLTQSPETFKTLGDYFMNQILLSKNCQDQQTKISSSNCITILNAAKFGFTGLDLSGCHMRGANLSNGMFNNVNFKNCDLRNARLTNIKAVNSKFIDADLSGAKFSILPDLKGHTADVNYFCFSPDSKYLFTSSKDNTCIIWDCSNCLRVKTIENCHLMNYSLDGKYYLCAFENVCKLYEASTDTLVSTFEGHAQKLSLIVMSPVGTHIATVSEDFLLKIWEVSTGKEAFQIKDQHKSEFSVHFSYDGEHILSLCGKLITIWNVKKGEVINKIEGDFSRVKLSPIDNSFVVQSGTVVNLFELESAKEIKSFKANEYGLSDMKYSKDGKFLAVSFNPSCKILNSKTLDPVYQITHYCHWFFV